MKNRNGRKETVALTQREKEKDTRTKEKKEKLKENQWEKWNRAKGREEVD